MCICVCAACCYTVFLYSTRDEIVPHRPPLTAERLAQIWDEHPEPVVLELLWEIHRLRSTISRANQVRRFLEPHGHGVLPGPVWECFNRELAAEPCLTDPPTERQRAMVDAILERRRREKRKPIAPEAPTACLRLQ